MGRAYEEVSSSVRVLRDALVLTVLSLAQRGEQKTRIKSSTATCCTIIRRFIRAL